jgi:hypothetical protein
MIALLALALGACSGGDGKRGADGMDGEPGADGTDGAKGDDGAPGDDGADGDAGAPGAKGEPGADGADGADGDDGADGADGDDGADGADGDDIILSETARSGLDLSPVAVDLEGLDGDEIESVGRGSYIVNALSDCIGCHSSPAGDFLAGNNRFPIGSIDNPAIVGADCAANPSTDCVAGVVFTRNLTPDATTGLKLTEDQFVKVLRTGRDFKDATGNTTLIVMPWAQTRWMAERDIRDIYRYLRTIPAVSNAVAPDVKPVFPPPPSPFYDGGGDPIDVPVFADGDVPRPLPAALDFTLAPPGPSAAAGESFDTDYVLRGLAISPLDDDSTVSNLSATDQDLYGRGSYIVNAPGLCNECHTRGGRNQDGTVRTDIFLAGGQAFGAPAPLQPLLGQVRTMSANLTGSSNGFDQPFTVFANTLLSGLSFTKGAPHVLGFPMPSDTFRNMTERDKLAVYTYIATIQQEGFINGVNDVEHQAPARYCTTATVATDCEAGETCENVSITEAGTGECAGGNCNLDTDCGACQTCVGMACVEEDAGSDCVMTSF